MSRIASIRMVAHTGTSDGQKQFQRKPLRESPTGKRRFLLRNATSHTLRAVDGLKTFFGGRTKPFQFTFVLPILDLWQIEVGCWHDEFLCSSLQAGDCSQKPQCFTIPCSTLYGEQFWRQ